MGPMNTCSMMRLKTLGSVFTAYALFQSFFGASTALAHKDDYIDETLVYLTLEKGEIEPEYWFDYGTRSKDKSTDNGKVDFARHNFAIEYGFTDQWMVDSRITLGDEEHKSAKFDSGRFETRYRFFEEGEKPIDIAISGEINTERDEKNSLETGIEPRLIFSKDLSKEFNLTLNFPLEIKLSSGEIEFIPTFGWRYNVTSLLRFGSEVKYNEHTHEGSIIPQVWFALAHEVTIKLGYSFGFDGNKEDFGRVAVEVEF